MKLKHVEITKIVMHAMPGANLGDCMREGVLVATKKWQNVELRHNGNTYTFKPNDLIGTVNKTTKENKP